MEDPRKLKRGLKDVSHLFESPGLAQPACSPPDISSSNSGIQCWSLFSPDAPEESGLLNAYLASQLDSRVRSVSLVSFVSPDGASASAAPKPGSFHSNPMKRLSLPWAQFETLRGQVSRRSFKHSATQVLLLDCDYRRMPYFEKMMPMLDKWILLLQPTLESLTESYKRIKVSQVLNNRLEYFLLSSCLPGDEKSGLLFEQFSALVARRLGVHLIWLGNLCFSKGTEPVGQMDFEHLFLRPMENSDSMEKMALAEFACLSEPHARFA